MIEQVLRVGGAGGGARVYAQTVLARFWAVKWRMTEALRRRVATAERRGRQAGGDGRWEGLGTVILPPPLSLIQMGGNFWGPSGSIRPGVIKNTSILLYFSNSWPDPLTPY